jgi:hypothetical protein
VTIVGRHFGAKKGKVYFEQSTPGGLIVKSCKVASWTMDSSSGLSAAIIEVPKSAPLGWCDVRLTNEVGSETKISGFEVRAP